MVDDILRRVKDAVFGSNPSQQEPRPSSQDPYGDPADQVAQGYGDDVQPASQDPYGDPAAQGNSDVQPASQDPYGDPADEQQNSR